MAAVLWDGEGPRFDGFVWDCRDGYGRRNDIGTLHVVIGIDSWATATAAVTRGQRAGVLFDLAPHILRGSCGNAIIYAPQLKPDRLGRCTHETCSTTSTGYPASVIQIRGQLPRVDAVPLPPWGSGGPRRHDGAWDCRNGHTRPGCCIRLSIT